MAKEFGIMTSALALVCAAACSHVGNTSGGLIPSGPSSAQSAQPVAGLAAGVKGEGKVQRISHVFVIVQENRSVDNLFNGFPGADTVQYGMSNGRRIKLRAESFVTDDHSHILAAFLKDSGCTVGRDKCPMDGFDSFNGEKGTAYAYVDPSYTKPYFAMAEQYAFGDEMFPSNIDASFVSHQYLVAAQAQSAVNFTKPKAACASGVTPRVETITDERTIGRSESACFGYRTIVDELAAQSLPWRYYMAPRGNASTWWNPFDWIPHDAQAPGGKIVDVPAQFISDIGGEKPYDAAVTWITPTSGNSDHAGLTKNTGPNWVASVVNAIGTSKYWDSSVIFVTWDDWGGWYDHVAPPFKDYDGLGIRVPVIMISPYTKKGLVTHRQYEQASILKFIEDRFGLSSLGAADERAADPVNDVMSNGSSTPRPFQVIPAGPYSPTDSNPPDDDR